ncbi:PIN domain-containing protein [Candidatus Woesearchaeota archaeon]|nr:PIN domain-containing protein [Candidatus Woesearchaeota archaeon]
MRIFFDTSVLVEVDRRNVAVIKAIKHLASGDHELALSAITVSELLTGAYLNPAKHAILSAKELLGQFHWYDMDGAVAERTAQLLAYLHVHSRQVEYQDCVIAATALAHDFDALLTFNRKDFIVFPALKDRVFLPQEFAGSKLFNERAS